MTKNRNKLVFIIKKFLKAETSAEENQQLFNYYQSYQQQHKWSSEMGDKKIIKERIYKNILLEMQGTSVKPSTFQRYFKYAAIIVITLGVLVYLLQPKTNVSQKNNSESIAVSEKNNSHIGSYKAILTLSNGDKISLEKGKKQQTTHSSSNGEQITYQNHNVAPTKITEYNYLTIPRGGQFVLELSDKTKVWLNSETKIKYPVQFNTAATRAIELVYGEIYLEVTPSEQFHQQQFTVSSKDQNITVLGTAFNLKAYKDEKHVTTTLVEGKINLSFPDESPSQILHPNQQLELNTDSKKYKLKKVNPKYAIAWKNGDFNFKNANLAHIMKVLSRWYNIEIIVQSEKTKSLEFTGLLSKNQKIEHILNHVQKIHHIKYQIHDKQIIIE